MTVRGVLLIVHADDEVPIDLISGRRRDQHILGSRPKVPFRDLSVAESPRRLKNEVRVVGPVRQVVRIVLAAHLNSRPSTHSVS